MRFNPDVQNSTQKAFLDGLVKLGARHRNFVLLDANVGSVLGAAEFAKVFPERHFSFGNAVGAMAAAASGFSVRGKVPFLCASALTMTGRSWESIRNFLCYPNLNVKIIGIHSGLLNGEEGAVNQSLEDMALMRCIPHMKVICPASAAEARAALEVMMLDYGPTYLRLFHLPLPELYSEHRSFVMGKGDIYKTGTDVCMFSVGTAVHTALDAAEILERKGVSAMVVNMASVKPIDEGLIVECAKSVRYVVTVEDHQTTGGLGSAVAEVLAESYPMRLLRIGMEGFGESGKVDDLYRKYGLDGQSIADKVKELVRE